VVNDGVPALARNATDVQQAENKDTKKKDGKAMFLIHQGVSSEIFEKIMCYENEKETWDTLEKVYFRDGKLKKLRFQASRRQYEMLTMEE